MLPRVILGIKNRKAERYLEAHLDKAGVQTKAYGQLQKPWRKLVDGCGDILVINESLIPPPLESSLALLNNLPERPITVILSDSDSSEESASLIAAGADVVLYAGISVNSLREAIESILESRRQFNLDDRYDRQGRIKPKISDFFSKSQEMQFFMAEVQQIIPSDSALLILGETGVGKEHLAKVIHAESQRSAGPFITVNTAAVPDQLLESELFGHERGAFTGAVRSRRGAFELAHQGTIFLDEIGDMPLHMQAKLLRVLQDFEVTPVGGEKPLWVDVRIIAATNRDLEKEVAQGNFRSDLYYRLNVVTLTIPPLRQRKNDIPFMAEAFVRSLLKKVGRGPQEISEEAMKALCSYDWPGNVRELMNVLERAMLLGKGREITTRDLPSIFHGTPQISGKILLSDNGDPSAWDGLTLPQVQADILSQVERLYLEMVLKKSSGRIGEAARMAGIHPRSLYNKMKMLGLKKEYFKK
ncbi:MAG: sigma-54-dependent Fis family transcriptional regulator [Deltaproteobacteria bacterium]|nr:sigma-54-dependent Fis family transcriptional regulator [Candidatus Anaeroferrophillus wilburensis]MBN2887741.1 sigma-54-dependent Fis family transcriptional regulator [Deltaproteobacteria bacterium]